MAVGAAREVVRRSGQHQVCFNEQQLDRIESTVATVATDVAAIKTRLIEGDGKIAGHAEKIQELRKVVFGGVFVIVLGVLATAGGALIWVISHYKGP